MHTCVHAYNYAQTHIQLYLYAQTNILIFTFPYIHIRVLVDAQIDTQAYTHKIIYMYKHIDTYLCLQTFT